MNTRLKKTKVAIAGIAFLLIFGPLTRAVQGRPQAGDAQKTAKIRTEVTKRVAGKKTKVKVKLRTGEELKGRIEQADDNGFTITQDKTNKQIQMFYGDVETVKGRGGLGTPAKIGIIAAVAVAVLAIVAVVAIRNFDPFSGGITVR